MNVAAEETLVAYASQGIAPAGDFAFFLELDELVQPLLPGAVGHQTAGVFVDDDDFSLAYQVMLVAVKHMQRRQTLPDQLFPTMRPFPDAAQPDAQLFELHLSI